MLTHDRLSALSSLSPAIALWDEDDFNESAAIACAGLQLAEAFNEFEDLTEEDMIRFVEEALDEGRPMVVGAGKAMKGYAAKKPGLASKIGKAAFSAAKTVAKHGAKFAWGTAKVAGRIAGHAAAGAVKGAAHGALKSLPTKHQAAIHNFIHAGKSHATRIAAAAKAGVHAAHAAHQASAGGSGGATTKMSAGQWAKNKLAAGAHSGTHGHVAPTHAAAAAHSAHAQTATAAHTTHSDDSTASHRYTGDDSTKKTPVGHRAVDVPGQYHKPAAASAHKPVTGQDHFIAKQHAHQQAAKEKLKNAAAAAHPAAGQHTQPHNAKMPAPQKAAGHKPAPVSLPPLHKKQPLIVARPKAANEAMRRLNAMLAGF